MEYANKDFEIFQATVKLFDVGEINKNVWPNKKTHCIFTIFYIQFSN